MTTLKKRRIKTAKAATKAPANAAPKAPEAKKAPRATKPTVPMHDVHSNWSGASDVSNTRVSTTPIDYSKFGTLPNAKLTPRDREAIAALDSEFGKRQFERANIDAGIIRRLGERGYVEHVSGASNEPTAMFKLTGKKLAA